MEPPDQQPLTQSPHSSVLEAWEQPCSSRPKAKQNSARVAPTRNIRRKQKVPKADKATEISPSFETMLKQRAASRRKKKREDKGYSRTQPQRRKAPSPSYPKQSFSGAPRRSKALHNLYMNLYEEVGEDGAWAVQRVGGLQKAFFIFSTLRNGRINVNNLLQTLHTLGILVTSTEMRQMLKATDIDANGNLSFTDFLEVLNETSPFAQTEAFQNTYQAFSKMRQGMISLDDLPPTLISMGISLSFETLQEALTHVPMNRNGQLNISDFLMAVSDLEHHYEDVESVVQYDTLKPRKPLHEFDLDAMTRVKRKTPLSFDVKYLQKADMHWLDFSVAHKEKSHQSGKHSSSQRPRFLSFQEKLPTQFDLEDSLEESAETTKSRLMEQRPPWSVHINEDLEESLEDVESPFAPEWIQKSWKSAVAIGPVRMQEPVGASAGGQYVSDYEALQDALEIVSKIKVDYIEVGELLSTLETMGIPLTDEEFQEALQKVMLEKDGMVNFNHFMVALANTQRLSEFSLLKAAISAISKIEGDKVAVSDLLSCLENMGIHLSNGEFKAALKLVSVDVNGKVYIKDFVSGLTKSPRFSELLGMQDTVKALSRIQGDLVDVQDLERILTNMGIHFSKAEFQEILASTTRDKDGRVKLEQFVTLVSKMQRFSELGALNKAIEAVEQIKEDKVKIVELESWLHNMGVHLTKEELEEATQSLLIAKDGTVEIKELMSVLTGTKRFSNFVAVQEALRAVKHIREDHIEVSHLATSLSTLGLRLANEVIGQVLKSAQVDEAGMVKFTDFMSALSRSQHFLPSSALQDAFSIISTLESEKITIENLKFVLSNLNITLSSDEFSDTLKFCDIDKDGTVNFKDVMMCMTRTRQFTEFEALQDALNALSKISSDEMEVSSLPLALKALGIHLTPDKLQEALTTSPTDESGKVNVKEFMKVLTRTPQFSEYVALQDALETINKIKEDKVPVSQLEQTLNSMGVHLTKESLQEGLKTATTGGNGRVNLKYFLTSLGDTQNFSELERLQNATKALSAMHEGKIQPHDLKSTLKNLCISLKDEEIQETLKAVTVDEHGKVNLKEFLTTLASLQHFSDSVVLQDALSAFSRIREGKVDLQDVDSILGHLGISLASEELQEALQKISPDENGKVGFKEFLTNLMNTQFFAELSAVQEALDVISKVEADKIEVSHLGSALANMGIALTKGELEEALKHTTVNGAGKVNFKEFMKSLTSTKRFSKTLEMEGAVKAIGMIKEDMVDIRHLEAIMRDMGVHLTPEEIQKALAHIACIEDGKVNLKDFMMALTKTQRFSQAEKDRVDVRNLDFILDNMGIYLTNEELQEALKHVTVDADGKVYLSKFLKRVRAPRRFSQGDRVAVNHLASMLDNMEIFLTEEELQEVLKHIKIDAEGKVNLSEFMNSVQQLSKAEGDMVDLQYLDSILDTMGIHLTNEELQEALKHATIDANGKVNFGKFMNGVKTIQKLSSAERDKVDVGSLDSILADLSIHLTQEKMKEALKHTPADRDGKVSLSAFMKSMMNMWRPSQAEKDKVDVSSLDSILANLGIHLTQEELQEVLKHSPADRDGKVSLSAFMKSMMNTRRPAQAERDKVDICNLDSILAHMGIYLTNEELQEALTFATVDADGKVNLSKFMQAVSTVQPMTQGPGEKVNVPELNSSLTSLGIHLTSEELQEALKHTTVNEDGTVNLKDFLRSLNATRCLSKAQRKPHMTIGPISDIDMTLKSLPKKMMLKSLPKKPSRELSGILLDRSKCKAAKNLTRDQLEAFHYAYNFFSKDADGNIDLQGLEMTAKKLEISLTEQEASDELTYADVDRDGKVNFSDFLTIVTDNKHFIQAVAPEKGSLEDFDSIDATGILLFEVLSKLVEMSALPRKAMLEIVSYYRRKFLESIGRRAWMDAGSLMTHGKKTHKLRKSSAPQKGKVTPMSAFAGAARISVMNNKELEAYVETLRASTAPSDSPYAQVPIFPLLPNRDGMIAPKPKKDLQKLEMQRRKEPISSFENHFFHKRNWLHEATAFKPPDYFRGQKPSLCLDPHLMERRHRLTIDDLSEIRLNVKKVTEMYKQGMALKERNRMLRLWRRLHGSQIGLESGNHSFYHTFSTYSWSWNARQELVTPSELQEYDNKLYHREHSSSCSNASEVKGRKGERK